MDLVRIRAELAAALADSGVNVYDHDPDETEFPAAWFGFPEPIQYDRTFANGVQLEGELFLVVDRLEGRYAELRLAAAVSLVDTRESIEALTESGDAAGIWLPPIKPLLEAHDANGAWQSLHVHEVADQGAYDVGSQLGLGVVFRFKLGVRPTT